MVINRGVMIVDTSVKTWIGVNQEINLPISLCKSCFKAEFVNNNNNINESK
jgi:hypothetical protein